MVLFILEVIIILNDETLIAITLEGKQSAKAEKLIKYLYEDTSFLYDIAHSFQDEERYTLSLLHDILNKIDYNTLATLGFRESYLKSLVLLFKDDISQDDYIDRLIKEDDSVAIDIAHEILEKENINLKKIIEERRINND